MPKETYVDRMKSEGKALRAKTYALNGYLNGMSSQGLSAEKRILIAKRVDVMREYSDLLDKSIAMEGK